MRNTLTAYNQSVQSYITYSGHRPNKHIKNSRINLLDEKLNLDGLIFAQLFPRKKSIVLDEILYYLSANGICKVGADHLANKLNVSIRTVYDTVRSMKLTNQFVIGRLADNGLGKYVFVDKYHKDFRNIMQKVFKLDAVEIAIEFASHFAGLNTVESIARVSVEEPKESTILYNKKQANNYIYNQIKNVIESEQPKTKNEQQEYLNIYSTNKHQNMFFDFINAMDYPSTIINDAAILALRIGSNCTSERFLLAKDTLQALASDIALGKQFENVVATFDGALKKAINETPVSNQLEQKHNKVTFYNWLEERGCTN